MNKNSEPKKCSPDKTPETPAKVRKCDCCGDECDSLICYDWNGENYYFCCLGCVFDFAEKEQLEVDEINHVFIEKDFDAQLDKVAAKARESVEWKPTREEMPYCIRLRDCNNIEKIVDDVLEWLGDRAEIFAVLLRERLDG